MSESSTSLDGRALHWSIERVDASSRQPIQDMVVLEEPLEVVINGARIAVLMRLPGQEKELAAGFSVSEGYVRDLGDVLLIHHCGLGHPAPGADEQDDLGSRNRVEMRVTPQGFCPPADGDVVRLIRSGCGAAAVNELAEALPAISHQMGVDAGTLLGLDREMRSRQPVHSTVGGTHAAALFDAQGRAIASAEDIGRHNAVDKVIGYCLLRGIPLRDKVLITSGRASYEMVVKAIRVGIPIVASVSSPTALAVQLAHERGLTLIGYLRGGRMNVYTHAQRVSGP